MTRAFRILTIIFISFSGLTFCQAPIKVDYKFEIEKGKIVKEDDQTFWVIPTTFTNQTKDTLKYFSMSCSWQYFYSVDNEKLKIEQPLCDKDIYIILKLEPNQSKKAELRLLISQTKYASIINFKIGFHLVPDQVFMDNYDFQNQLNKKIIWSNEISM